MDSPPAPTRSATEENFPVGSWLLPRHLRAHIARYYAFARAADDIADDPARRPDKKRAELDAMEAVLRGEATAAIGNLDQAKAERLAESLRETRVPVAHAAELLIAFRLDADKSRYATWDELMGYCRHSAAPVGRYLLDLHGESHDTWPAADALCASLQVLNHLQDCAEDYASLDRVYIPLDMLDAAGTDVTELTAPRASAGMRRVLDACLDGCDRLNSEARVLPGLIRNRRMRMEAAVIVAVAHRLARRLRAEDPLAGRVALGRGDKVACLLTGLRAGLW
ncbi:MAG: squalene synthase HpnC [Alphaproteobacteria bacterium]|nr:squalene synthase HpnC [Alphaproteobacteria bacterium]